MATVVNIYNPRLNSVFSGGVATANVLTVLRGVESRKKVGSIPERDTLLCCYEQVAGVPDILEYGPLLYVGVVWVI